MLFVKSQDRKNKYCIRYFHLNHTEETNMWDMIAMTTDNELVLLGSYTFYKQAIDVFAQMDYMSNKLMYFKRRKKQFVMPINITDERVCIAIYGSTY